ncbi:hypothetical protein BD560DRAFT_429125 [Blakeslea trispora]|nr:hypothetical protein BD560DRAFT_429125 [Blakeslea trispora]
MNASHVTIGVSTKTFLIRTLNSAVDKGQEILDNFYHGTFLELNQDDDHPSEPVTFVQYVSPEPRPVSPEPLSPQRPPSYEGEPHEAPPPLPEHLPRANSINFVLHPNYTHELPEEGARIVNDFVANGVNEHICMQLLKYFAMTFKNLLTTVEK